jgi:hypothetical protein
MNGAPRLLWLPHLRSEMWGTPEDMQIPTG